MRRAKEETQMGHQAPTARRERQPALLGATAVAAALGLLTAALAAWADPSMPAWQWLRQVALLAAGEIPVRLGREAAAYCAHTAEHPARRAARTVRRGDGVLAAPAPPTYDFGLASPPGRDALPTGGART